VDSADSSVRGESLRADRLRQPGEWPADLLSLADGPNTGRQVD